MDVQHLTDGQKNKYTRLISKTGDCSKFLAKLLNKVRYHVQKSARCKEHVSIIHYIVK